MLLMLFPYYYHPYPFTPPPSPLCLCLVHLPCLQLTALDVGIAIPWLVVWGYASFHRVLGALLLDYLSNKHTKSYFTAKQWPQYQYHVHQLPHRHIHVHSLLLCMYVPCIPLRSHHSRSGAFALHVQPSDQWELGHEELPLQLYNNIIRVQ